MLVLHSFREGAKTRDTSGSNPEGWVLNTPAFLAKTFVEPVLLPGFDVEGGVMAGGYFSPEKRNAGFERPGTGVIRYDLRRRVLANGVARLSEKLV